MNRRLAPPNALAAAAAAALLLLPAAAGPCAAAADAAKSGRSTHELLEAGTVALEESNFARAGARFREAAGLDPGLPQARLGIGLAALGEGDRKTAERSLRDAVEASSGAPETRYALGVARFVFGDLRAAADDLQGALDGDRYLLEARYAAGVVAAARGDLPQAASSLREALRIDAGHAASHYQLGAVLARSGDLEGGLDELGRALAIDPALLDARPEDPIFFGGRDVQSSGASATLGLPLPLIRPSIAWTRSRTGGAGAAEAVADWFLYYQMALDLLDASQWRGAADMLERAVALKDRSEAGAVVAGRLIDYGPHLHLAEAYHRLGNYREAFLHLNIAKSEGNAPEETLRALEVLITRDRLRPRLFVQPLPDRTADETVTVRGLVLSEEPVDRVEVAGREAVLRTATPGELSAILPEGTAAPRKEGPAPLVFEAAGLRLPAIGPNRIAIRPRFKNPARDGDQIEVLVVREPPAARPKPAAAPHAGAAAP